MLCVNTSRLVKIHTKTNGDPICVLWFLSSIPLFCVKIRCEVPESPAGSTLLAVVTVPLLEGHYQGRGVRCAPIQESRQGGGQRGQLSRAKGKEEPKIGFSLHYIQGDKLTFFHREPI